MFSCSIALILFAFILSIFFFRTHCLNSFNRIISIMNIDDTKSEEKDKAKRNETKRKNTVTYHLEIYKSNQPIGQRKRSKMIKYNETHSLMHTRKIYRIVVVVVVAFFFNRFSVKILCIYQTCLLTDPQKFLSGNIFRFQLSRAFDVYRYVSSQSIDTGGLLSIGFQNALTTFINTRLNERVHTHTF